MRNIWKNTFLFAFSLLFQGVNFFLFLWLHDTDLLSSLFHAAERLLILFQKVCCCSLRCFKITATLWDHLIRRKKFRTVPNESVFNKRIKDCTRLRVLSLTLNMWHENISFAWHLLFIIIYVCVYLTRKIPHFWEFLIELLLSQLSGFRNECQGQGPCKSRGTSHDPFSWHQPSYSTNSVYSFISIPVPWI